MRCRWGGPRCDSRPLEGKRFCGEHQAILDRIRGELERGAGRSTKMVRRCAEDDCRQPRSAGSDFCPDHGGDGA